MTEKEKAIEDEAIEDEAIELSIDPTEKRTKKPHRRRAVVITVVVLALLAAGGIAWKTHTDRLMAEARADCAAESERLHVAATAYNALLDDQAASMAKTDVKSVKDTKTLDVLSKAVKASTPKAVSCKADSRDAVVTATKAITANTAWYKAHTKSLNGLVNAVETSKLDKTVDDANALYKETDGKVADGKTRASLLDAIKKRDAAAIAKAVKEVNESKAAKEKAGAFIEGQVRAGSRRGGRRAAGAGIAIPVVLVRLILEPRELFIFVQQRRRLLVRAVAIHQQRRLILGWFQFRPAHRHWRQRRPCPERAMQARKHLHGWRLQHLPMIRHMMRAFLPADVQTGLAKNEF